MWESSSDESASELENLLSSKEPAAVLDAVLGSTPSGAVIVRAPDGKIVRLSDFAARLLGRDRSEIEGRVLGDGDLPTLILDPTTGERMAPNMGPLSRALRGETVTGCEILVRAANGELVPCVCNAAPIRNWRGELIGAISSIADLRPYKALEQGLREAVAQRETLYRELSHRVKNHLQIMSSLVALEARDPSQTAASIAGMMKVRLQVLAAVYDGMAESGVGARVEAFPFFERVCRPYATGEVRVEPLIEPGDLTLASEQAGPLGMLANEAVCNCCKHAFPEGRGIIRVALSRCAPGRLRLEVADDGVGWSPSEAGRASYGVQLMKVFAAQLHGELAFSDRPGGGALVTAELPESAH